MSSLADSARLHRYVRYDAKTEILKAVGALDDIELYGNQLICAPYIHSGLLWNPQMGFPVEERLSLERLYELYEAKAGIKWSRDAVETAYQGKVMLVLKIGPSRQADADIEVGDWVFTLQELTRQCSISTPNSQRSRVLDFLEIKGYDNGGWPCKFVYDVDLYGRIRHQDAIV